MSAVDLEHSVINQKHTCCSKLERIRSSRHIPAIVVVLATFLDSFCYGIIVPFQPFYQSVFQLTDPQTGLLLACYAMSFVPIVPFVGVVSDRIGRQVPFTVGVALLAASTLLFAFTQSLAVVIAARLMQGLAAAFTWACGLAILHDTYGGNNKAEGFALASSSIGMISGPPLAGILLQYVGYYAPFLFAVGLCGLDLLLRLFTIRSLGKPARRYSSANVDAIPMLSDTNKHLGAQEQPAEPDIPAASAPPETRLSVDSVSRLSSDLQPDMENSDKPQPLAIRQQLRVFFSQPLIVPVFLLVFAFALAFAALELSFPLYMSDVMLASPAEIGLVYAVINVAYAVASATTGWLTARFNAAYVLLFSMIAVAPCSVGFGLVVNLWSSVLVAVVYGYSAGLSGSCALALLGLYGERVNVGGGLIYGLWNAYVV
eukprot:TRINITY_DN8877_c0_g2_i1.p1 TRINITY_DN8877_c0_g2~~TRINITY_DN8877_c0_g2_i1.p1  ORF type:complete len:429 (-),score=78.79 TRINITY_DN8877_c0_g2_i1:325-1611(-)